MTATQEQPISGPTLMATPRESLLKDGGSLTMTTRSSAYIGSSPWWLLEWVNNLYWVLPWRLPLGSLLKDGDLPTMTARSSTYIKSSPWCLLEWVNSLYQVLPDGSDEYHYHLYFVPLLYLFCYTFNTAWVYFLMFMQKLGQDQFWRKKIWKEMKIRVAAWNSLIQRPKDETRESHRQYISYRRRFLTLKVKIQSQTVKSPLTRWIRHWLVNQNLEQKS